MESSYHVQNITILYLILYLKNIIHSVYTLYNTSSSWPFNQRITNILYVRYYIYTRSPIGCHLIWWNPVDILILLSYRIELFRYFYNVIIKTTMRKTRNNNNNNKTNQLHGRRIITTTRYSFSSLISQANIFTRKKKHFSAIIMLQNTVLV